MGRKRKKTVVIEEEIPEERYEVAHKVTLRIEPQPYIEMREYAKRFTPDECSGMGLVEREDNADGSVDFVIKEVFLPNQYNSGGRTDIPDEEMNKLNTELVIDGKDTSKLQFHWHSHVDFGVFHSGTDDENYDDLQTGDYLVSLVVNNAGDMLGSVHIYKPLRIDVCNIEVETPSQWEVDDLLEEKLDTNVKRVKDAEPELRKKHVRPTLYQPMYGGTTHHTGFGYDFLASDPDFEALLKAGEKEGIITLFYDTFQRIYGYMNNRTGDSYEICSEMDYPVTKPEGGYGIGY